MRSENAQTRAILHGRRYYKNSRVDQEFATVDHAHVNVPGTEFAGSCARLIWSVGRVCSYTHGDFFVGKSVVVQSVVLSVKSLNIRMHNQRCKNISKNQRCCLLQTCSNTPCPHAPGGQHRWHCRGTCPTDRRLRRRFAMSNWRSARGPDGPRACVPYTYIVDNHIKLVQASGIGLAYSLLQAERFRSWKGFWESSSSWADSLSHR